MEQELPDLDHLDRTILSFFDDAAVATNAPVVSVNTGIETAVVKNRLKALEDRGYLKLHGYSERLFAITTEGERVLAANETGDER